jgi:hypothetical protein
VLQTIADVSADRASVIGKFDLYRRQFEAVASDKFDRGEKGPIKITGLDILQFVADRKELPKET